MADQSAPWTWDTTSIYDLLVEIVNEFLVAKFGKYHFYTEATDGDTIQATDGDTIQFWIPRKLTRKEKADLKSKGPRAGKS
ncbi:hypothetical protein HYALB_00008645 [Hymenoscyphus albidus]|uniref:Uncharacterized protein n=1 Tax=Hymenoscyphus albidus TaxID=595503 RepID=A0A9N9LGH8_9HELO|nr:hypothetical protein HYALB_00008645 [Hymenoscyphus albidus]